MPSPNNRTKAIARSEDTEEKQFRGFEWFLRGDMSVKKRNESAENTCTNCREQSHGFCKRGSRDRQAMKVQNLNWTGARVSRVHGDMVPVLMAVLREFRSKKDTASKRSEMTAEYRV